jgi:signal peptidase I
MTILARIARISGAAVLLLAAAWFFLPMPLGGSTTYVSTFGTSMEPGFTAGDLAILRPSTDYRVGDIVAYDSADLGTTVMHRIVDGDADGYVMQGDNNSWLDEETPAESEVMGRLWLHVPQGGKAIAALRSPSVLVLVAVAAVTILLSVARKPRGRHTRSSRPAARTPYVFSNPIRARARQVTLAAGVAALLAGVGTSGLLLMPDTQTDTRTLPVTQQGRFAYTGSAVQGTTYPTGVIETGDPVWTKLADGLTVSFEDVVTGATEVAGTVRLDVTVTAPDGWSALLATGPAAPLLHGTATASVPVDPAAASALIDRHYEEIGAAVGTGVVTVVPVVEAAGTVESLPFIAGSPGGLSFAMDETALRLSGEAAALAPTTQTSVSVDELAPRTFSLGSVTVSIETARRAAGAVLLVALVALVASLWIGRPVSGTVVDQLLARHAGRILEVRRFTPGSTIVDLADADALFRVAERLDSLVLHHEGPRGTTFAVRDGETTYRYVVRSAPVPRTITLRPVSTRPVLGRLA